MATTLGGSGSKSFVITVDREGNADYGNIQGAKGDECIALTKDYEAEMGQALGPRQETGDMYESQDQHIELDQSDD